MTHTLKTISYTCTAVFLGLALLVPQVFANHAWGNFHWASTTDTFTLQLLDSMKGPWDASLVGAAADWSESSDIDLVIADGGRKSSCRGKDGKIEACNASYGDTGWLGIASVWADANGHIVKGTVQMNDTYFNTSYYNTDAWRNLVVCQEIGHTLGLGHQDEAFGNANLNTCMDYTNSPDSNQHPNAHDYEQLAALYSHIDAYDSYAVGSTDGGGKGKPEGKGKPQAVGQDIDPANPSSWGKAVKSDAQGNPSLYVRNLGNGQTVVTHITWVEGHTGEHE